MKHTTSATGDALTFAELETAVTRMRAAGFSDNARVRVQTRFRGINANGVLITQVTVSDDDVDTRADGA